MKIDPMTDDERHGAIMLALSQAVQFKRHAQLVQRGMVAVMTVEFLVIVGLVVALCG